MIYSLDHSLQCAKFMMSKSHKAILDQGKGNVRQGESQMRESQLLVLH